KLAVPLCKACASRWTLTYVGYVAFALLALFGLPILFGTIGNAMSRQDGGWMGAVAGLVVYIAAMIAWNYLVNPKYLAVCDLIDGDHVTLKLPHADRVRAARERAKGEQDAEA